MNEKLNVSAIQRHCVSDGPGVRTTIFLQGCSLRCPWCCNPETQDFNEVARMCSTEELFNEVMKDEHLFSISNGGVTLSGGEPLLQADRLVELLHKLKENKIHIAMETTLYVSEEKLRKVKDFVDFWYVDLKLQFASLYTNYKSTSQKSVAGNLKLLQKNNSHIEYRMVFMKECLTNLSSIRKDLNELNVNQLTLLFYHSLAESKYERMKRKFSRFSSPSMDDYILFKKSVPDIKLDYLNV